MRPISKKLRNEASQNSDMTTKYIMQNSEIFNSFLYNIFET